MVHFNLLRLTPLSLPRSLYAPLSLPLFGCVTPPPPSPPSLSRSLQTRLYILFEFRHTKDVSASFLTQAMNGDAVDVCVCKEIAISASVSIILKAFHVCVSERQCREGRGVCSAPVRGIGTTEGYEVDQCV